MCFLVLLSKTAKADKATTFVRTCASRSSCYLAAHNIRHVFLAYWCELQAKKMGDILADQFICAFCHVQANQRCTGCHETFYCSREHQKLHWRKHKNQCCAFKVSLKVVDHATNMKIKIMFVRVLRYVPRTTRRWVGTSLLHAT